LTKRAAGYAQMLRFALVAVVPAVGVFLFVDFSERAGDGWLMRKNVCTSKEL